MKKFFPENKIWFLFLCLALFLSANYASALTITPIRLEIKGNPGQTLNEQMTLINEHNTSETFYSSYANFEAEGETGNPAFVIPKDGLGTWMKAADTVLLKPGESKIISFSIAIPQNAEPGGYFAALFWGTQPPIPTSTSVSIGAKTGMLILLSVNGTVKQGGGILNYDTKGGIHYYDSLPVMFSFRFKNDGGDRIKPEGNIVVRNMLGLTSELVPANVTEGNILPTQIRYFETSWVASPSGATEAQTTSGFFNKAIYEWHNFALGRYTATLDLTYGVNGQKATAETVIWIFPWHFLILFIVSLLLLLFLIKKGLHFYNNYLIEKAEERIEEEEGDKHHHSRKII